MRCGTAAAPYFLMTTKPKSLQTKWFGWKPDLPDVRDLRVSLAPPDVALPPFVDLSTDPAMPAIYDQGPLGSCTGNAIAAAVAFLRNKMGAVPFAPSRLFIYYNERLLEGTVDEDAGAYIRDGFKAINHWGVAPESMWKYDVAKFAKKPTVRSYQRAMANQALVYQRVPQNLNTMKALLHNRVPIVFGFSVYESFESAEVARTGDIPMPSPAQGIIAGHAMAHVGYDESRFRFINRNSWNTDWGRAGYCTMPYDYALNPDLSDDLWVVTKVELGKAPAAAA
jgi:C1A family cysteine protease